MRDGERGQATPLLLVVLLVATLVAAAVAHVGAVASRSAAAQAAADATALAGVVGDRPAAVAIARANEASIVAYRPDGAELQVVIERAGLRATARARWDLGSIP